MTDEVKEILEKMAVLASEHEKAFVDMYPYKVTVVMNHEDTIIYPCFLESSAHIIYDEYDVTEMRKMSGIDSIKVLLYENSNLRKRKIIDYLCVQETIYH